jgi:hypothetical protein
MPREQDRGLIARSRERGRQFGRGSRMDVLNQPLARPGLCRQGSHASRARHRRAGRDHRALDADDPGRSRTGSIHRTRTHRAPNPLSRPPKRLAPPSPREFDHCRRRHRRAGIAQVGDARNGDRLTPPGPRTSGCWLCHFGKPLCVGEERETKDLIAVVGGEEISALRRSRPVVSHRSRKRSSSSSSTR